MSQEAGSKVQRSPAYQHLVSLGLACYGAIHLLLAWLCIQVAMGGGAEASPNGALKDLVNKPLGNLLMMVFALGLFALVVWQGIEALWGYTEQEAKQKVRRKAVSGGRAVVYAALGATALSLALGKKSGDSNQEAQGVSATLMSAPAGQVLVGLVGAAVFAVGISQVVKGVRRRFVTEDLVAGAPEWGKKLGSVGWCIKGVSIALVGMLFGWAALSYDPNKAGGVDDALKTLRDQPFGMFLLIAIGIGFACFGVYSLVWARYPNHENI